MPTAPEPLALFQVLLIVVGALVTVLLTVLIAMQSGNKKSLENLSRDIAGIAREIGDQKLLVARDYMTHDQHERYHEKERRAHES